MGGGAYDDLKDPFIQQVEKANWPLAEMLRSLPHVEQAAKLTLLFDRAYKDRRDQEAKQLLGWMTAYWGDAEHVAHRLLSEMPQQMLSERPDMALTDGLIIRALAPSISKQGAAACLGVLAAHYRNRKHLRKAITEAIQFACKNIEQSRLAELLALHPPPEIAEIFLHALVRNFGPDEIRRVIRLAPALKDFSPTAMECLAREITFIRKFDAKVQRLVSDIECDFEDGPTIKVEYAYSIRPMSVTLTIRSAGETWDGVYAAILKGVREWANEVREGSQKQSRPREYPLGDVTVKLIYEVLPTGSSEPSRRESATIS